MQTWLVNGEPDRVVDIADRGLAYGDGLFETIAVRNGQPRFLERHLARLLDGCRRLSIPEPPVRRIGDEVMQLVTSHRGTIKVIVTRGAGTRGYRAPAIVTPTRAVGFTAEQIDGSGGLRHGIRVIACRTRFSSNTALAGLKTLNRLDNVLARLEWQDESVPEGLMCDAEGRLISGTMSNLFMVRGGRLLTPTLDRCGISGVMRGVVLEVAAGTGISASEALIGAEVLAEAEELFLTNALIGLWPVTWCGGREYPIGPVTRAIAEALVARGVEECGT